MIQVKTLADQVYEKIKEDIVSLRIKPGEKLSESQLAAQYMVSRAPVRDAIRKLQQDKLVLVKPQIGTIVAPVSLDKARDICQIRLLLEPYAAEVAAEKITVEDQKMLTNQFAKIAQVEDDPDLKKEYIHETDTILHKTIWRLCENREIYHIIDGYKDEIHRIRLATAKLANRLVPTEQEMKEIYWALLKKDRKASREAMYSHISNLKKAIEGVLAEENESF